MGSSNLHITVALCPAIQGMIILITPKVLNNCFYCLTLFSSFLPFDQLQSQTHIEAVQLFSVLPLTVP